MGDYKMVGSFSNKVNRYMEADVGIMNSVFSIMKEEGANISGEPPMGQVLC